MLICGKSILIFGGAGSLGTELVRKLLPNNQIVVASRDEAKHWELKNKFNNNSWLQTAICDIRNYDRVFEILIRHKPAIVIAAAAMKQVDTCEYAPGESIDTNILGIRNLLKAVQDASLLKLHPECFCFVSTDKACNPINIYGMCKAISEKMVLRAAQDNPAVKYVTVRYGNVLNSKGSIIPLFQKQVQSSESLTLTDERMTRFMMTLNESVALINSAITEGANGDMFIPALSSMKIIDLANYFSKKFGKTIKTVGIRPGEKIHEVLLNEEEAAYANRIGNNFIINKKNVRANEPLEYSSKDRCKNYEDLKQYMDDFLKEESS